VNLVLEQQPSTNDFVPLVEQDIQGFGVCDVLLLKDPRRERVIVVCIQHWQSFLQHDRAVVEFFVHQVHGASGNSYAIVESLLLRFEAWERWQQ